MEWYYAEAGERRGPVSGSVFLDLVAQGVIRADTLVWNPSMSDWVEYGALQGQPDSIRTSDTVITGPRPASGAAQKTEPLAIVSLVLAFISCGCGFLVAIGAVVCGHVALNRIKESQGQLAGRELAMGGLVLGYLMLVVHVILNVGWLLLSI